MESASKSSIKQYGKYMVIAVVLIASVLIQPLYFTIYAPTVTAQTEANTTTAPVTATQTAPPNQTAPPPPPANTTSTGTTINASASWYTIGPKPLSFPEEIVGVCYPWLVMQHQIENLVTGKLYPGVGGDTALNVYCSDRYFIVHAKNGVYVFNKETGTIVSSAFLSTMLSFIGATNDTYALYDSLDNIVVVKTITGSDIAVPIKASPSYITYTMIGNIPIVLYTVPYLNKTYNYYIANPVVAVKTKYNGTGALLVVNDTVYLETNGGIAILKITNPYTPSLQLQDFIPLPFRVTAIIERVKSYILVSASGILALVGVEPGTPEYKSFKIIGSAIPVPNGYYVPETETSYLVTDTGIYPVPGQAVALLSTLAFTNIKTNSTVEPVAWPLQKTVFVVKQPFKGELYVSNYAVKLDLAPGTYMLPYGAVIKYSSYTILLNRDIVEYPPTQPISINIKNVANIHYKVAQFPKVYIPVTRITAIEKIYSGGGYVLLLTKDKAIVYGPYGVTATIPGRWIYGGIGSAVVLYDGATFRIYDFAGNEIASYQYYITTQPDYISCTMINGQYVVLLYMNGMLYKIYPSKIETEPLAFRMIRDPTTGLTVTYQVPTTISLPGGFTYGLPLDASSIHINKYYATWTKDSNLYILSIPDATVYVLMNQPENTTFYPLSNNYVVMFNTYRHTVDILAYKSWLVGQCYIHINTYADSKVFVNGKYVGTGPLTVYTMCGSMVNVTVTKQYYKPVSKEVTVQGPTTLNLYPKPIESNVKLVLVTPKGLELTAVQLEIKPLGEVVWNNGQVKTLLARPYEISIKKFYPVDVCEHYSFNTTLPEGSAELRISCQLTSSVLALHSNVSVIVKIYPNVKPLKNPVSTVLVKPNQTTYVKVAPGTYIIKSEPMSKFYAGKTLNVTVPEKTVVPLDVTPLPLGHLVVNAVPRTASIVVLNLTTNKPVATASGKFDEYLPPGGYMIRVEAPGYIPYVKAVSLQAGQTLVVNATLTHAPPPPPPPKKPFWANTNFQILAVVIVAAIVIAVLYYKKRKARSAVAEEETEVPAEAGGGGETK